MPLPSPSTTVSVTVKRFGAVWDWSVKQVDPRPLQDLGGGTTPSREQAWADAASVINDQGES